MLSWVKWYKYVECWVQINKYKFLCLTKFNSPNCSSVLIIFKFCGILEWLCIVSWTVWVVRVEAWMYIPYFYVFLHVCEADTWTDRRVTCAVCLHVVALDTASQLAQGLWPPRRLQALVGNLQQDAREKAIELLAWLRRTRRDLPGRLTISAVVDVSLVLCEKERIVSNVRSW